MAHTQGRCRCSGMTPHTRVSAHRVPPRGPDAHGTVALASPGRQGVVVESRMSTYLNQTRWSRIIWKPPPSSSKPLPFAVVVCLRRRPFRALVTRDWQCRNNELCAVAMGAAGGGDLAEGGRPPEGQTRAVPTPSPFRQVTLRQENALVEEQGLFISPWEEAEKTTTGRIFFWIDAQCHLGPNG